MKKYILIFSLTVCSILSADDKILKQIPNDFNILSSVNIEAVLQKEMPFIKDMINEIDDDKIFDKFEKGGLNLKLFKRLWFAHSLDTNMHKVKGDWSWLTFVEFSKDIKVKEILNLIQKEFKLEILEGKIGDLKSYEINNGLQDIIIVQTAPRLVLLGSKDSLKQSQRLSKMGKNENLQYSLLGNKQIADLQATVNEHQVWMTLYTKNPDKFANVTDLVFGMDFDKALNMKCIINFADDISCQRVYNFWPMLKGWLMQKPLFMENKHFSDTKFDTSIMFKIIFTKDVLRRAGMVKEKPANENDKP